MSEKYNGWTNYATWRVNLEFFTDYTMDIGYEETEHELSLRLKEIVEDTIEGSSSGIANGYAMAFISDVNWYEIAEHILEETEFDK
jgi:hypothetical protein